MVMVTTGATVVVTKAIARMQFDYFAETVEPGQVFILKNGPHDQKLMHTCARPWSESIPTERCSYCSKSFIPACITQHLARVHPPAGDAA
jgi:hypothetical protein